MIVSHKHKYIFLKTNKTAGTSIEIALSRYCGPEDIITPVSPEDEVLRREVGGVGPQNHLAPLSDYGFRDYRKLLFGKRKLRYFNHMTATRAKALLGDEIWQSYFKFCIERNPWDRVISHYFWRTRKDTSEQPTIMEYLESPMVQKLKRKGLGLYTIDGELAVDRVCLLENLSEDLESVRVQLGLPEPLELPRAKSQYRKDKRSYRDILGEPEKEKIAELFADEIRLFGYRF